MDQKSPDIYRTPVNQGVALAWVNSYSAAAIKTREATLLFDPVSMELPNDAELDLIAISHSHTDHWDPHLVAALQHQTQAVVATSPYLSNLLNGTLTGKKESSSTRSAVSIKAGQSDSNPLMPMQPGDQLTIGDVNLIALRCDHAAVEPLSFLISTADGITVYLPGDTTPFCGMEQVPHLGGKGPKERVDIMLWMGTALEDGARIAQLVQPKVFLTYAIAPPAAGIRATGILTRYTPDLPFRALERHEVFSYPR